MGGFVHVPCKIFKESRRDRRGVGTKNAQPKSRKKERKKGLKGGGENIQGLREKNPKRKTDSVKKRPSEKPPS